MAFTVIIRWIHLLATVAWIGGMFTNFFIYIPSMKKALDPAMTGKLLGTVMKRFRVMAYVSMFVILVTGTVLGLTVSVPDDYSVLSNNRMFIVLCKVVLFVLMAILAVFAFEFLAPRVARLARKGPSPELARKQRSQGILALAGFILGILILVLSAAL